MNKGGDKSNNLKDHHQHQKHHSNQTPNNLEKTLRSAASVHDIEKVQATQGSFTDRQNFEFSHENSAKSSDKQQKNKDGEDQEKLNNKDVSLRSQQDSLFMRSCDIKANTPQNQNDENHNNMMMYGEQISPAGLRTQQQFSSQRFGENQLQNQGSTLVDHPSNQIDTNQQQASSLIQNQQTANFNVEQDFMSSHNEQRQRDQQPLVQGQTQNLSTIPFTATYHQHNPSNSATHQTQQQATTNIGSFKSQMATGQEGQQLEQVPRTINQKSISGLQRQFKAKNSVSKLILSRNRVKAINMSVERLVTNEQLQKQNAVQSTHDSKIVEDQPKSVSLPRYLEVSPVLHSKNNSISSGNNYYLSGFRPNNTKSGSYTKPLNQQKVSPNHHTTTNFKFNTRGRACHSPSTSNGAVPQTSQNTMELPSIGVNTGTKFMPYASQTQMGQIKKVTTIGMVKAKSSQATHVTLQNHQHPTKSTNSNNLIPPSATSFSDNAEKHTSLFRPKARVTVGGGGTRDSLPSTMAKYPSNNLSSQAKALRKYTHSLSDSKDSFVAGGGFGQQLIQVSRDQIAIQMSENHFDELLKDPQNNQETSLIYDQELQQQNAYQELMFGGSHYPRASKSTASNLSFPQCQTSQNLPSTNPATMSGKQSRKQRLYQILHAASRGRSVIKPSLEAEDIAHQYYTLKKKYNAIAKENQVQKVKLRQAEVQISRQGGTLQMAQAEISKLKKHVASSAPLLKERDSGEIGREVQSEMQNSTKVVLSNHHMKQKSLSISSALLGIKEISGSHSNSPERPVEEYLSPKVETIPQNMPHNSLQIPQQVSLSNFQGQKIEHKQLYSQSPKKSAQRVQNLIESTTKDRAYKGKIDSLTEEISCLHEEIAILKQSQKVCVYEEIQAQLEAFQNECGRLRSLLEVTVKENLTLMKRQKMEAILPKQSDQIKAQTGLQSDNLSSFQTQKISNAELEQVEKLKVQLQQQQNINLTLKKQIQETQFSPPQPQKPKMIRVQTELQKDLLRKKDDQIKLLERQLKEEKDKSATEIKRTNLSFLHSKRKQNVLESENRSLKEHIFDLVQRREEFQNNDKMTTPLINVGIPIQINHKVPINCDTEKNKRPKFTILKSDKVIYSKQQEKSEVQEMPKFSSSDPEEKKSSISASKKERFISGQVQSQQDELLDQNLRQNSKPLKKLSTQPSEQVMAEISRFGRDSDVENGTMGNKKQSKDKMNNDQQFKLRTVPEQQSPNDNPYNQNLQHQMQQMQADQNSSVQSSQRRNNQIGLFLDKFDKPGKSSENSSKFHSQRDTANMQHDNPVEIRDKNGYVEYDQDQVNPQIVPSSSEINQESQDDDEQEIGINPSSSSLRQNQQPHELNEEQMLDIAEIILRTLAEKLIEHDWALDEVFDHPELVQNVEKYESELNLKILSAQNFLGRIYQLGIKDLNQLQVACLMRVLGKPDLDNSILYRDLTLLLTNYGCREYKSQKDSNQEDLEQSDGSQTSEEQSKSGHLQSRQSDVDPAKYTPNNDKVSSQMPIVDQQEVQGNQNSQNQSNAKPKVILSRVHKQDSADFLLVSEKASLDEQTDKKKTSGVITGENSLDKALEKHVNENLNNSQEQRSDKQKSHKEEQISIGRQDSQHTLRSTEAHGCQKGEANFGENYAQKQEPEQEKINQSSNRTKSARTPSKLSIDQSGEKDQVLQDKRSSAGNQKSEDKVQQVDNKSLKDDKKKELDHKIDSEQQDQLPLKLQSNETIETPEFHKNQEELQISQLESQKIATKFSKKSISAPPETQMKFKSYDDLNQDAQTLSDKNQDGAMSAFSSKLSRLEKAKTMLSYGHGSHERQAMGKLKDLINLCDNRPYNLIKVLQSRSEEISIKSATRRAQIKVIRRPVFRYVVNHLIKGLASLDMPDPDQHSAILLTESDVDVLEPIMLLNKKYNEFYAMKNIEKLLAVVFLKCEGYQEQLKKIETVKEGEDSFGTDSDANDDYDNNKKGSGGNQVLSKIEESQTQPEEEYSHQKEKENQVIQNAEFEEDAEENRV